MPLLFMTLILEKGMEQFLGCPSNCIFLIFFPHGEMRLRIFGKNTVQVMSFSEHHIGGQHDTKCLITGDGKGLTSWLRWDLLGLSTADYCFCFSSPFVINKYLGEDTLRQFKYSVSPQIPPINFSILPAIIITGCCNGELFYFPHSFYIY